MNLGELSKLTPRELEVVTMVASSMNTKEIAAELQISDRTVEHHRQSIRKKLDLKDAAAFTRFAIKNNLIEL